MESIGGLSDEAILAELGSRLARRRVELELTQEVLARRAGVGKRTVERMEAGGSSQVSNLVRVLRVLGLLGGLDMLVPASGPRPMELLATRGRRRQRASPGRSTAREAPGGWRWGDES